MQMNSVGTSWISGYLDGTNSIQNNTIPINKLIKTASNNYKVIRQDATSANFELSLIDNNMINDNTIKGEKLQNNSIDLASK